MCDMPADRIKNTLVLRLWPASEENGNWTSVKDSGVDTLLRAVFPYPAYFLTTSHQARLPA